MRPGEKPPKEPAAARLNAPVGALEFAYYWFKALDWGYATTDSTLAKQLYLRACNDCARLMRNYDNARTNGEHFSGGRSTLVRREIVHGDDRHPDSTVVDVRLMVTALRTINAQGRTVNREPAIPRLDYRVWIKWDGRRWSLLDMKEIEYR